MLYLKKCTLCLVIKLISGKIQTLGLLQFSHSELTANYECHIITLIAEYVDANGSLNSQINQHESV